MDETRLDVISGFLGAGKTTLINKLLREAWRGERTAVLENEFGAIGVDGDLLRGQELMVKEITNGCICCTLKGDFVEGIEDLAREYRPDRIVIEPTGIGKLGDILDACRLAAEKAPVALRSVMTVAQAPLVSAFLEVSGDFYREQIAGAPVVVLSAAQDLCAEDPPLEETLRRIRELNPGAVVFAEPWDALDSLKLLAVAEELTEKLVRPEAAHSNDHDPEAEHKHERRDGHSHEHDHEDHDHVLENAGFDSCSFILQETWTEEDAENLLAAMQGGDFGEIFRAKGFFPVRGRFHKLEYVYGRVSFIPADYSGEGKVVVIGRELKKAELKRAVERLRR
ncbi:MAG: GTP-binding protein [Treponema sp.]|jgi:G3E family GTPase|nr:GTP-binding protein [Treponema sp.]